VDPKWHHTEINKIKCNLQCISWTRTNNYSTQNLTPYVQRSCILRHITWKQPSHVERCHNFYVNIWEAIQAAGQRGKPLLFFHVNSLLRVFGFWFPKFLTSYYRPLCSLQLRYHLKWWSGPKKISKETMYWYCNILYREITAVVSTNL
jgi:hypothetical protein